MAMDWTYDLFVEDCDKYTIEDADSDDYRAYFIGRMKLAVQNFTELWNDRCNNHLYDDHYGYIGNAFEKRVIDDDFFSDFYKEAYGQRPHLPSWYYVHKLGLIHSEDTARLFCSSPIENAINNAKYNRMSFED